MHIRCLELWHITRNENTLTMLSTFVRCHPNNNSYLLNSCLIKVQKFTEALLQIAQQETLLLRFKLATQGKCKIYTREFIFFHLHLKMLYSAFLERRHSTAHAWLGPQARLTKKQELGPQLPHLMPFHAVSSPKPGLLCAESRHPHFFTHVALSLHHLTLWETLVTVNLPCHFSFNKLFCLWLITDFSNLL